MSKMCSKYRWKIEYFIYFCILVNSFLGKNNLASFVSHLFGKLPMLAFQSYQILVNYPLVSTLLGIVLGKHLLYFAYDKN